MAEDSLIEEMRATIRGDRERAEQRRSSESPSASTVQAGPSPEVALPPEASPGPEPEAARGFGERLRWLRRRRDD